MDPSQCKQFEVEIVDDLLGNLSAKRSQALLNHLKKCESCRKLYNEWQEILKNNKKVAPPATLYERLKKYLLQRRFKQRLLRSPTFWSAASVIIIIMFVLATPAFQDKQPLETLNSVKQQQLTTVAENTPPFLTDDIKTVQYLISPQEGQLTSVEGIIWVNSHLGEMYFYVQNLEDVDRYDYQVWLVKLVKKESGGLLQVIDRYNGELYLHQRNIQEIQQISISLEPKGGSPYPTTDDTVLVDFCCTETP